ncbi:hypothetical protein [Nonomuraea sp. NPDC049684]|uniref:hypothetical protein n=1 Tax=Nonomuraea sp. NPDC049684 TaxID=3364356 RepID=UPI003794A01C
MTIKRFATIMGAALLAVSSLAAPAQAATGHYSCDTGNVLDEPTAPGSLHVNGEPCYGAPSGGIDAIVIIKSGQGTGTYLCDLVLTYPRGNLGGFYCQRV